jgi:ZIP family zinc transporter
MNDLLAVVGIAALAAGLTYLGVPVAERYAVPQRVVSAALQFAAGIITALVAVTLMPPAMRNGPYGLTVLAFFAGGVLYVLLEYYTKQAQVEQSAGVSRRGSNGISIGLFVGILVDLFVDGVVIGIGSTLDLVTGLIMALGLALSTAPLAFVTIATAKRQGMLAEHRRLLGWMFVASLMAGALLGYLVLQHRPLELRMVLVALASGFLITTVVQGIIPEANREGEPGFAGVLYIGGLSLYALMSLALK